jgi:hypothetical protein
VTQPDPDPLTVWPDDDVAETIAVDLFRDYRAGQVRIGRDGRAWRGDAYRLVARIRELDGHSARNPRLRDVLVGALAGAILALVLELVLRVVTHG